MSTAAPRVETESDADDALRLPAVFDEPSTGVGIEIRHARLSDVPTIATLLEEYARRGFVLPRTLGQIYRHIREFLVAVEDGEVVACVSLRIYYAVLAEVGALAVAARCQGRKVGRHLVEELIEEARAFGIRRVFALTLQEPFFHRLGFRTVPLDEIPEKVAADRDEGIDRAACMKATVVRDLDD